MNWKVIGDAAMAIAIGSIATAILRRLGFDEAFAFIAGGFIMGRLDARFERES